MQDFGGCIGQESDDVSGWFGIILYPVDSKIRQAGGWDTNSNT